MYCNRVLSVKSLNNENWKFNEIFKGGGVEFIGMRLGR